MPGHWITALAFWTQRACMIAGRSHHIRWKSGNATMSSFKAAFMLLMSAVVQSPNEYHFGWFVQQVDDNMLVRNSGQHTSKRNAAWIFKLTHPQFLDSYRRIHTCISNGRQWQWQYEVLRAVGCSCSCHFTFAHSKEFILTMFALMYSQIMLGCISVQVHEAMQCSYPQTQVQREIHDARTNFPKMLCHEVPFGQKKKSQSPALSQQLVRIGRTNQVPSLMKRTCTSQPKKKTFDISDVSG